MRYQLYNTTTTTTTTTNNNNNNNNSALSLLSPCSLLFAVTALHCASSRGHVACVDVLLTSSANVNSVDFSGCTPLVYAITRGHSDTVTSLLQHGADPSHVDLKGRTYVFTFHRLLITLPIAVFVLVGYTISFWHAFAWYATICEQSDLSKNKLK